MRVLLISGDKALRTKVRDTIINRFTLEEAYNGLDGSYLATVNTYSVIIIDTELCDINGIEICRMTRASNVNTPILLISNNNTTSYKVAAFDSGIDGYITKPVDYEELYSRIKALIRRTAQNNFLNKIKIDNLTLDLNKRYIQKDNAHIYLRKREFELLELLMINTGHVLSKEYILESIWQKGLETNSNTLEVHIRSLRKKIENKGEKKYIKTIHGIGYKIE